LLKKQTEFPIQHVQLFTYYLHFLFKNKTPWIFPVRPRTYYFQFYILRGAYNHQKTLYCSPLTTQCTQYTLEEAEQLECLTTVYKITGSIPNKVMSINFKFTRGVQKVLQIDIQKIHKALEFGFI